MSRTEAQLLPRLGLLNCMPAPVLPKTEKQWCNGFAGLAEVVPVRFDDDPRATGSRSAEFVDGHAVFSDAASNLDGIIVTGANLERRADGTPLPFEEISYIAQLGEVIDWANDNARLAVYSCLASHIALNRLFGINRLIRPEKIFGVYCHDRIVPNLLTTGIEGAIPSPHSRWGDVPARLLETTGVTVLAEGFEAGWLLAETQNSTGRNVFLQGHPEYWQYDLAEEYARDQPAGQAVPHNYFPGNDPARTPRYSWQSGARQLFKNLAAVVEPSLVN